MLWSPWRSYFTTRSLNPFLAKWWWWPPLMRWSLVVGVTFRGSCQAPGQCLAFHFELAPLAPSLRVSMCLPAEKLLWSPLWPSCTRSFIRTHRDARLFGTISLCTPLLALCPACCWFAWLFAVCTLARRVSDLAGGQGTWAWPCSSDHRNRASSGVSWRGLPRKPFTACL